MSQIIQCCRNCVAPKRHPGCHGTCPDYLKERANYDELKAIEAKKAKVRIGCYQQRDEAVRKMLKGKR